MTKPNLMLVVACTASDGPTRHVMNPRVLVDMAFELPDPMPTMAEMQPVAYAAKMALAKVLRKRKKEK